MNFRRLIMSEIIQQNTARKSTAMSEQVKKICKNSRKAPDEVENSAVANKRAKCETPQAANEKSTQALKTVTSNVVNKQRKSLMPILDQSGKNQITSMKNDENDKKQVQIDQKRLNN